MTDAEAEEIVGDGLIMFGSGLAQQHQEFKESLNRRAAAAPIERVVKKAALPKKASTRKKGRKGV